MTPTTTNERTFGAIIREARIAKGWSLREFARILGITSRNACDIELDRRIPAERVIEPMALLLGLDKGGLMARAGRLTPDAERFARAHPKVLQLVERIAALGLDDHQIGTLIVKAERFGRAAP